MRVTILCMFVLYAPYASSASLHIDNQSRFIAVIIDRHNDQPCTHASNLIQQCLVPPLTRFIDDLPDTLVAGATLRLASMPTAHASAEPLNTQTFKGIATVTYQPVGPLKYEQLTCHTPISEGVSIGLRVGGAGDMACQGTNDQRITWVYKHNDLNLNVVVKDLIPVKKQRH